jgi:predicted DNA-binding transcriptional regulator YafY
MEKNKIYILLYMYSELKEGRVLIKDDIIDKFDINERTFYRYIKEIKELYITGICRIKWTAYRRRTYI